MSNIEQRHTLGAVEIRKDGDAVRMGGYALKFDRLSQNLGGFVERVAPGAVAKTLRDGGDVLARFQHLDEFILGRTISGTLRLGVDETGLTYEVDLPNTGYARDLAALAERGDVQHSSFAFRTIEDEWGFTEQGFPLRTLLEIQLVDVAPVVNPAYMDTSSGLRALAEARSMDPDAVAAAAAEGRLAEIITPAVVEDGGATDSRDEAPGDTHAAVTLRQRRAALDHLRNTR